MMGDLITFRSADARIAPFTNPVASLRHPFAEPKCGSTSTRTAGAPGPHFDYQDRATPDDAWTVVHGDPYLARLHREGPHSMDTLYRSPLTPRAAREELRWMLGTIGLVVLLAAMCAWGRF